ncbi:hypothetical protein GEMRC1_002843 [Eukaryota sp. GEM-RC1]
MPPQQVFATHRVHQKLRKDSGCLTTPTAVVYFSGVLESLVSEVLDRAGEFAHAANSAYIKPRHVMMALHDIPEVLPIVENTLEEILDTSSRE